MKNIFRSLYTHFMKKLCSLVPPSSCMNDAKPPESSSSESLLSSRPVSLNAAYSSEPITLNFCPKIPVSIGFNLEDALPLGISVSMGHHFVTLTMQPQTVPTSIYISNSAPLNFTTLIYNASLYGLLPINIILSTFKPLSDLNPTAQPSADYACTTLFTITYNLFINTPLGITFSPSYPLSPQSVSIETGNPFLISADGTKIYAYAPSSPAISDFTLVTPAFKNALNGTDSQSINLPMLLKIYI